MRETEELRRKLFDRGAERETVFSAVVTEVNENDFSCTVRREAVYYYDVRLRGLIVSDLKGAAMIPKLNSTVLVCRIGGSNELFICLFTEVEKIVFENEKIALCLGDGKISLNASGTTAEMSADGVVFNGGDNGAIVKIKELNDNLNSLKTFVEAIHAALPTAFSAIGAGAASVGGNGATSYNTSMTGRNINIKDMANDAVKH